MTIQLAIAMLRAGMPLPVDLQASLIAGGFDVAALERRYG